MCSASRTASRSISLRPVPLNEATSVIRIEQCTGAHFAGSRRVSVPGELPSTGVVACGACVGWACVTPARDIWACAACGSSACGSCPGGAGPQIFSSSAAFRTVIRRGAVWMIPRSRHAVRYLATADGRASAQSASSCCDIGRVIRTVPSRSDQPRRLAISKSRNASRRSTVADSGANIRIRFSASRSSMCRRRISLARGRASTKAVNPSAVRHIAWTSPKAVTVADRDRIVRAARSPTRSPGPSTAMICSWSAAVCTLTLVQPDAITMT